MLVGVVSTYHYCGDYYKDNIVREQCNKKLLLFFGTQVSLRLSPTVFAGEKIQSSECGLHSARYWGKGRGNPSFY
jgi:hypothetical protein